MLNNYVGKQMNLGIRIKTLRKAKGWSQLELSKRTNISRPRIAQIETNPSTEVKSETMRSLAKAFDLTVEQLSSISLFDQGVKDNELTIRPITNKLPILIWDDIQKHLKGKDMQDKQWVGSPSNLSNNAFAMAVENTAMVSNIEVSFNIGSIIFIEPDINYKSGDKVVALCKTTNTGVFRTFIDEANQKMLIPSNSQYQTLNADDYLIIGVVVGSYQAV
jgi:transcriptional regulator with XRE-family HTH domain